MVDKLCLPVYISLTFRVCQKGREYVTLGLFFDFFLKGGDSDGLYNS